MKKFLIHFWNDTEGQDLVEYALITAAIALGMIAVVKDLASALNSLYESITASLGTAGTP